MGGGGSVFKRVVRVALGFPGSLGGKESTCKLEMKETHVPDVHCSNVYIVRTWKQPKCPLADEWIRKLWYIYTMEYYSAIKKSTFELVLMRWMKLEPITQSEVSQKENTNTVCACIYMEFRKTVMMTLYARQQKRHRCKEQTFGLCGRRQGWDDIR